MTGIQRSALWMVAWLAAVFFLSMGLSWLTFGDLETKTLVKLGVVLLAILAGATIAVCWSGSKGKTIAERPAPPPGEFGRGQEADAKHLQRREEPRR